MRWFFVFLQIYLQLYKYKQTTDNLHGTHNAYFVMPKHIYTEFTIYLLKSILFCNVKQRNTKNLTNNRIYLIVLFANTYVMFLPKFIQKTLFPQLLNTVTPLSNVLLKYLLQYVQQHVGCLCLKSSVNELYCMED